MRRSLVFLVPAVLGMAALSATAADYVLTLGDTRTELDLGKATEVVLPDGQRVRAVLEQKAEQRYRDTGISFDHPATVHPNATDIDSDIRQVMLLSASGNGVIMQRYRGTDPTALIDLMINELTDEEVAAGYERTITPATRKLADGRVLSGKLAHTQTTGEAWDRHILAIGDRKGGYLVISMMEKDHTETDTALLERFWRTLALDPVK